MNNGNQAAYPVSADVERENAVHGWGSIGITKREAFALAAMQGVLANPAHDYMASDLAAWAVEHADALLTALEQPA